MGEALTALDSSNGDMLWEFQTGAGANSTVSAIEHEGTQYVAFYAGGNLFANSPRGDRVWLFSLDGQMGPAPAPTTLVPETTEEAALAVPNFDGGDASAGRPLYVEACETCHGATAEGGHNGVPLRDALSAERIYTTLVRGRNDMPAFGGDFSPEQLRDIVAYVRQPAEQSVDRPGGSGRQV